MAPIYTIEHGGRTVDELVAALRKHRIECLVDARPLPGADEVLGSRLPGLSLRYVYLGHQLGEAAGDFGRGVQKLRKAAQQGMRVALLCLDAEQHSGKLREALEAEGVRSEPLEGRAGTPSPEEEQWGEPPPEDPESSTPPLRADLPRMGSGTRATVTFEDASASLREVFGFQEFRPLQETAVRRVLAGEDTLAVMPTGGGKSLIYQLPALLFGGLTLVISPLISLMRDQVEQLNALGVPATFLNSSLSGAEYAHEAQQVTDGQVRLLYVAPETLVREQTLRMLDRARVQCFAIDEAHCISHWGHDFRPVYRQLLPVRKRFADAVCIALTATAAPRVRQDIQRILSIPDEGVLVSNFDRPNLFLGAIRRTGVDQLFEFLRAHPEQPGIVYCGTQKATEQLAADLTAQGWKARPYHAGLETAVRNRHQREFNRDEVQIIVATVAFGMGINKPNIRFVAHFTLPESLEAYYQEIGRAGRDGLRADCLLLHGEADAVLIRRFIDQGAETERAGRQARLNVMRRYALTAQCRRAALLPYFGDDELPESCGMCDNCTRPELDEGQAVDLTEPARLFVAAVQQTGQLFGIQHLIDVLRGSKNKKLLDRGHDRLAAYNSGVQHSAAQWRAWVDVFLDQGVVEQDLEYGSLKLTSAGLQVVRGEQKVLARAAAVVVPSAAGEVEHDRALFERLRALRKQLADRDEVPPFVVFSDRSLVDMARFYPQSEAALLGISGVGAQKLARYGGDFLKLLREYCSAQGLEEQKPTSAPPAAAKSSAGPRAREVGRLFAGGNDLASLQERFGVQRTTVVQNLAEFHQHGGTIDAARLLAECSLPTELRDAALRAFEKLGADRLRPTFDELGEKVTYDELHLLRLYLRARGTEAP